MRAVAAMVAPAYLSVAEAADYLGMSIPSVYRRIKEGVIPAVKLGERVLVVKDELDERIHEAVR